MTRSSRYESFGFPSLLRDFLAGGYSYFVFFLTNLWFNVRTYYRLLRNPENGLHVIWEEMQRVPGPLVFLYGRRGRRYFLKDGTLLPALLNTTTTTKHSSTGINDIPPQLEKMGANRHWPIGHAIGKAATASGDDALQAIQAKSHIRTIISPNHGIDFPRQLQGITKSISSALREWALLGEPFYVYEELVEVATIEAFRIILNVNLEDVLKDTNELKRFTRAIDTIVNTRISAVKDPTSMKVVHRAKSIVKDAMNKIPTDSTFGGALQELINQGTFTHEMGHDNVLFYICALSTMSAIHLHWVILTLLRHPEHLPIIRRGLDQGDRTYLQKCQKEVLRLFPPVSAYSPRRAVTEFRLAGHRIPAQSLIFLSPVLLVDDFEFRPDRWDEDHTHDLSYTDAQCEKSKAFYAPFSLGMRSCCAKSLVSNHLEDLAATILHDFDFEWVDPDPWPSNSPPALQHIPDNQIGFRPAKNIRFKVRQVQARDPSSSPQRNRRHP